MKQETYDKLPQEVIDEIARQIENSPSGYSPLEALIELEEDNDFWEE